MRKVFIFFISFIIAVVLVALIIITCLTFIEYKPADKEEIDYKGQGKLLSKKEEFSILTWNLGYSGLDAGEDFFMDGGKNVNPESKSAVERNLFGEIESIKKHKTDGDADFIFLQEVDESAQRTYFINEVETIEGYLNAKAAFAKNMSCFFIPYPIPPIGKTVSGIMTFSDYSVSKCFRNSLPCPFAWPVKVANFKRCFLETRVKIKDSSSELILINLHLDAFENENGREEQLKHVISFATSEYYKGNYVIIGGDFNMTFPFVKVIYKYKYWQPAVMKEDLFPNDWKFFCDTKIPSARSLNIPFTEEQKNDFYMIDGFVFSPNVEMCSFGAENEGFAYSDHNPVIIRAKLK